MNWRLSHTGQACNSIASSQVFDVPSLEAIGLPWPDAKKSSSGRFEPHAVGDRQRLVGAVEELDRVEDHVLVAKVRQIVHLELAGPVSFVPGFARIIGVLEI